MRQKLTAPWITILVGLAMLTVTMPAMASHNSIGPAHVHILDPDEFDADTGELVPDIPHEAHPHVEDGTISPHHLTFHNNLEIPREAPIDQTGHQYTDCDGPDAFASSSDYEDALRSGDACYVGYMDQIIEYMFSTLPGIVTESPADDLYSVNPSPDDDYCRGQEDTNEHTEIEPVDETITNAERITDDECGPGNDNIFLPGDILIDTSLVEAANEEASDQISNGAGSGSYTLGFSSTTYTFLLGQPHPDNVEGATIGDGDNVRELSGPSQFKAGEGPFGPNPAEFGNPLHDMTGACGDRTQDCTLLTPSDIILYDPWFYEDDVIPPQPRVCSFIPQLSFTVIGDNDNIDRDQGVCGNTGTQMDEFSDELEHGGFGIDEAPPTWVTNLPGWSWGVLLTRANTAQHTGYAAYYTTDGETHVTKDEPRPGLVTIHAVNPDVPTREGDLRCLIPNILAAGDGAGDIAASEDDGVYGEYQAAAIDVDIYPHPYQEQIEPVIDATHAPVRDAVGPFQEAVFGDRDFYDHLTDPVTGPGQNVDLAQDVASDVVDEETVDEVVGEVLPPEVEDAVDRANMVESSESPSHAQPGPQNQHVFEAGLDQGLACDASGDLLYNEEEVDWDAGMRFQASVNQMTTTLKDPTLFDENGLPAPESETDEGYWQADVYSFNGDAQAVVDFTETGSFGDCPGANLLPGDDLCPWESIWDAYSGDQCQNRDGESCGVLLDEWGYDLDAGVGGYFVLEVTGPTLVTSSPVATDIERVQDQTAVLGTGDPTAQNCIVGTTIGFEDYLPNHIDGAEDAEDLVEQLCDVDGESMLIADAFSSQSGVTPGTFSAQVSWIPLVSSPAESGFGDGDALCVTGIWSTENLDREYTADTAGENNINLEADGSVYTFHHWQSLETGTDTPGHEILPDGYEMCGVTQ